jgi:hypothetical protein
MVSIGLIPDSTGSPVTYPVTIGLAGQPSGLHPGGYAVASSRESRSAAGASTSSGRPAKIPAPMTASSANPLRA